MMKFNWKLTSSMVLILAAVMSLPAHADDDGDDDDEGGWSLRGKSPKMSQYVDLYRSECSTCHVAFPTDFLPAKSWQKIMGGLDDHFGDNAELAAEDNAKITEYLVANSAENAGTKRGRKVMRRLGSDEAPLRITEIPYFVREHNEVPRRALQHEKIGNLSNCAACHTQAEQGSFREREINIPGYGRWDD